MNDEQLGMEDFAEGDLVRIECLGGVTGTCKWRSGSSMTWAVSIPIAGGSEDDGVFAYVPPNLMTHANERSGAS